MACRNCIGYRSFIRILGFRRNAPTDVGVPRSTLLNLTIKEMELIFIQCLGKSTGKHLLGWKKGSLDMARNFSLVK